MLCKSCKQPIDNLEVYCTSCGLPTKNFKEQFSVGAILRAGKEIADKDIHYPIGQPIGVMLFLLIVVYVFNFDVLPMTSLMNYVLLNISLILVTPLLLLNTKPFSSNQPRQYLRLALLTALLVLYFFVLKLVCQGDPILNLVRLVLVLWGLAIAFPVFYLLSVRAGNVFSLIERGYVAGKYLRWQQFSLVFVLGLFNLLSVCLLLVPFPRSLHFTSCVMGVWYQRQENFGLYDKPRDY